MATLLLAMAKGPPDLMELGSARMAVEVPRAGATGRVSHPDVA